MFVLIQGLNMQPKLVLDFGAPYLSLHSTGIAGMCPPHQASSRHCGAKDSGITGVCHHARYTQALGGVTGKVPCNKAQQHHLVLKSSASPLQSTFKLTSHSPLIVVKSTSVTRKPFTGRINPRHLWDEGHLLSTAQF